MEQTECPICLGLGYIIEEDEEGNQTGGTLRCENCAGRGYFNF